MLIVAMPLAVAIVIAAGVYLAGPGNRRTLLFEIALLTGGFLVYFGARVVTEGSVEASVANGQTIIDLQFLLGIYVEPELNAATADRPWLLTVMNWIYIWGHWPLIAAAAIWLYRANPFGYRLTRNAFLISGSIGLVFFMLLPTAPPRLMGLDFVDTVTEYSHSYRLLQPPTVTNQYAAFPSLHFGWNLLIGIAVVRYARRRPIRVLGGLSPLLMLLATILTANHYLLDAVAGGVVALAGLGIAAMFFTSDTAQKRPVMNPEAPQRDPQRSTRFPRAS